MRFLARAILAAVLILGLPAYAGAAGGDIVWQYGDSRANQQMAVAASVADASGNTIVTGFTQAASEDFLTGCFKADGSGLLWSATYDRAGGNDRASAIALDLDGNVLVTGYVWNGLNFDFHTIKYNGASGAVIWQHSFDAGYSGADYPAAVAIDGLNNVYVAGRSQGAGGNEDFMLIKYPASGPTADGKPLWQKSFNSAASDNDGVVALAAGASSVAVTGYSRNGSNFDWLTRVYGTDGTLTWSKVYDSTSGDDQGRQVAIDSDGSVVVSGYKANGSDSDIYVIKYSAANGTVLWTQTHNGGYGDEPKAMLLGSGEVYLTGVSYSLAGFNDFYTARLAAATGVVVWEKSFDSGGGNADVAAAIALDSSGDVFVAGHTQKFGSDSDWRIIKYSRDAGTQLWQSGFNGAAGKDDKAVGLGFAASGALMVAGWSDQWTAGSSDYDCRVIDYDAGLLNAPTALAGSAASETSVDLSWQDNSANEDGFAIFRDSGSGYQQIATVGANVTTYTNTGLTAHLWYSYKVQAYSAAAGDSHFSDEVDVLTTVISYAAPSFSYIYNSTDSGDDFARAVAVGPDGHPVIAGSSLTAANGSYASDDYFTVKLDRANASLLWKASYNDADDEEDQAVTVTVASDNTVTVSGNSSLFGGTANTNDLYTRKYLSTGPADGAPWWGDPFVWGDAYNGPGGGSDRAVKAVVLNDGSGNIAVTGYGRNAGNNDDIYLIKYNGATGARLWTATPYNGNNHDYPADLASDASGNIFVAGRSHNGSNDDIFLRKYNAATGSAAWTVVYNHSAGNDEAKSIAVDASGNVYLAGYVTQNGSKDYFAAKYNGATGGLLWSKTYNGPGNGNDDAVKVALDPINGEVVVVGTRNTGTGNNDFHVIRYDTSGNVVWSRTLERTGNDDYAIDMAMDLSGNICVAGNTGSAGAFNVLAISYDQTGTIIGSSLFNGAANGNDQAAAVVASRYGETFVAGFTTNGSGNADYLVMNCNGTTMSAPTGFAATPLYTSVGLSWTDNSLNEDSFQIERKLGSCASGSPWTTVTSTAASATSYSNTGLNSGSSYCYRIRSHAASGLVSPWVEVAATTTAPPAPTGFSATVASSTLINLAWTDNTSGEDAFSVERCTGVGCSDFAQITATAANATAYADSSVCEGQSYSYRVLASKTGDWVSAFSAIDANNATTAKATPTSFNAARISEAELRLTWVDATSDETGFEIDRCAGAGCDFSTKSTYTVAANATSYNDTTSVVAGETYRYRIRSYKTASCSWSSDYSAIKDIVATLLPPSGFSATPVNTTRADLVWTDNTGTETGFEIDRCEGVACDFSTKTTVSAAANATTYSDTTVCAATTYRYRVRAISGSWNSGYSAIDDAATASITAPTLSSVNRINETRIDLAWTDATSDETGFEIERCVGTECDFSVKTTITVGAGVVAYSDTGLAAGTSYRYRVRAYKTASCSWSSAWSAILGATTTINPPSVLTATTANTTRIDLGWTDNTSYETSFVVERCQGGGCSDFAEVGAANANAASYADNGICASTAYQYRIKAVNEGLSNGMNACWTRKKPVTVTSFQANSLVRLSVTYDGDMQVDFDDLRFFDETAGAELPYWIESKTDGASAVIWLKTGANNAITAYYGNASATAVSSSTGIFEFYDTFRGAAIDTAKWVEIDPNASISQNNGLQFSYASTAWDKALISQQTFARVDGKVFYARLQAQDSATNDHIMAGWELNQTANANYNQLVHGLYWNNTYLSAYQKGVDRSYSTYATYTRTNTDYEMKVELKSVGARYYIRGGAYPTWVLIQERSDLSDTPMRVAFTQYSHQMKVDFAAVSSTAIADASASLGAEASSACYVFGGAWQSSYSTVAGATTATPAAATGLTATPVSESQIDLSWTDASNDETGFRIERCQGAGCSNFAVVATRSADTTSYSDIGLPQGTTFVYRIETYKTSACGWSDVFSNTASASTVAPPAPDGLSASNVGTTRIDLAWNDNTGSESGFSVERCTGAGCSDFAEIGQAVADSETYADTSVCYGTSYSYRVRAFNEMSNDGGGAWARRKPATITGFVANTKTRVVVAYDADMQADYDDIRFYDEMGQAELPYWIETSDAGSAVVWFTPGVNDNVSIYYGNPQATSSAGSGVVAANPPTATLGAEEAATTPSPWNTAYTSTATDTTDNLPAAPVLSGVRFSEARLDLSWNDTATDETGYEIERCTGSGCSNFALLTTAAASATSYSDASVAVETTYRYRVRAVKTATCGWNSPDSNSTADITASVLPPSGLAATPVNSTRIDLAWTDNTTSETGFAIERCAGAGCSDFASITTTAANAVSYSDTSVAAATTYRYRLRAAGSGWNSSYSATADGVTPTPAAPSGAVASRVSEVAINLAWTDNTNDETGFQIERCAGEGCSNFALLASPAANAVSYPDTGLAANTVYQYRIRAYKTATQSWNTAYSATTSATTTVNAPSGFAAATPNTTQVNLSWADNTVSETGFEIERCLGAGCSGFAQIGTAAANATSYSDTGVCSGSTYSYRVRAVKSATWNSPYSSVAADVALATPTAPSGLSAASSTENQVDLSWTDNTSDETGFQVESCVGAGCSNFALINSPAQNQTAYSNTGLNPSTTYCYRVRAVKAATCSWSSAYSATACDLSIEAAPSGLAATALDSMRIRLDWTDNAGDETGYRIEEKLWNGKYATVVSVAANATTYTVKLGIEGGKTYTYRVRAVRGVDLSAPTGDASATTPAYQAGDTVCQ